MDILESWELLLENWSELALRALPRTVLCLIALVLLS